MITKEKGILIKSVFWDLMKTWLTDRNANWPTDGQTDRQIDRPIKGQANGLDRIWISKDFMIWRGEKIKTQISVSYKHLACVGTPLQTLEGADISHEGFFLEIYQNIFKTGPSPRILANSLRNYSWNKVNFLVHGYHHLTCFCSWW